LTRWLVSTSAGRPERRANPRAARDDPGCQLEGGSSFRHRRFGSFCISLTDFAIFLSASAISCNTCVRCRSWSCWSVFANSITDIFPNIFPRVRIEAGGAINSLDCASDGVAGSRYCGRSPDSVRVDFRSATSKSVTGRLPDRRIWQKESEPFRR
jgi:hypothetical protein